MLKVYGLQPRRGRGEVSGLERTGPHRWPACGGLLKKNVGQESAPGSGGWKIGQGNMVLGPDSKAKVMGAQRERLREKSVA